MASEHVDHDWLEEVFTEIQSYATENRLVKTLELISDTKLALQIDMAQLQKKSGELVVRAAPPLSIDHDMKSSNIILFPNRVDESPRISSPKGARD